MNAHSADSRSRRSFYQLPQATIQQMPIQQMPIQQVPPSRAWLQSGPLQQVKLTESAPEGTGEYRVRRFWCASTLRRRGRQSADQARIWSAGPRVSFPAR